MSNKIPGQLSEEDLLKLLSDEKIKEKQEGEDLSSSSPLQFLTVFNIKSGKYRIKTKTLYNLYKKWAKEKAVKPNTFTKTISPYLSYAPKYSSFDINERDIKLSQNIVIKLQKKGLYRKKTNKRLKEHIDKYIVEFDLKRGENYILADKVHEDYWMWAAKTKKTQRIRLHNFIAIMKLYFNVIKNQHNEIMIGFESYNGKKEKTEEKNTQK